MVNRNTMNTFHGALYI